MSFRFVLNKRNVTAASITLAAVTATTLIFTSVATFAQGIALTTGELPVEISSELHLEVLVNGNTTNLIAKVYVDPDGTLSMDSQELHNVGILPSAVARRRDGRIDLARLPKVAFIRDDLTQTLAFKAPDSARIPREISARRGVNPLDFDDPRNRVQSDRGALVNYTLNANGYHSFDRSDFDFGGISGTFETRLFGPPGAMENSFALSDGEFRRLSSTWSFSDPRSLYTVRGGDIISGGLSWTRPTRLGGAQIQRNFGLRSDLITMPVPGFMSSAAVPSTVEVYLDNTRRFSSKLAPGPFEVTNMPVVTGAGTARIVVRDEDGNETVTNSDYFASDRLLRPGLMDYSVELGFPRTGYGSHDDGYSERLVSSASIRYGFSNKLTLEGHAEGGDGLVNGGLGFVSGIGSIGVGSFAAAGSKAGDEVGYQLSGSVQFEIGKLHVDGRIQHSFGEFNDVASITQRPGQNSPYPIFSGAVPRSLEQVSISFPTLDKGFMNLNYTQLERTDGFRQRLVGASFGRPLFGGSLSAGGYADVDGKNYGVFASLSLPIDGGMTSNTSLRSDDSGISTYASISRPAREENDKFAWNVSYEQGDSPRFAASGDKETPIADVGGTVRYSDDFASANAHVSGSIVTAGGDVFASRRINDAFAIVNVGASSVPVLVANRPAGVTGRNGKLLVPDLRSYERNRIAIDPTNLPLDKVVDNTRQLVIPAAGAGVVVNFGSQIGGGSATVSFKDPAGHYLELGTTGQAGAPFMVGYDGQALVEGLNSHNSLTLQKPDGTQCNARFSYVPQKGTTTVLPDVICTPI